MVRTRILIAYMLGMACFTVYVLRTNINILLNAMVERGNASLPDPPDYGPRYQWSRVYQNEILRGYHYGYTAASLFGGTLAEKLGARNVICTSLLIGGVMSLLQPFFADKYYRPTLGLRIFTGLSVGACYPACHTIIAKWAPPVEKSKFIAALMGGTLGAVITVPVTSFIIKYVGWKQAFYLEGLFCIAVAIVFYILVTDDPNEHWFITPDEEEYINETVKDIDTPKKFPPYLSIFTSLPFIALTLLHFGNNWGFNYTLNYAPRYIVRVLHYNITEVNLRTLPNLMRFFIAFIFGHFADTIRKKESMSVTAIRKYFCITSHIIPGLLLITLGLWVKEPIIAILLMSFALGFNSSAVVTNLQNCQDLAPTYAGTLFSIIDFFANFTGIITALVIAPIVKDNYSPELWTNGFFVGGIMYIAPAIIFAFLGSGKVQPWNFQKDENVIGE